MSPRGSATRARGLMAECGSSDSSATSFASKYSPQCSLGTQLGEGRQLLAPRPLTFYSVDILNPDMVVFHGRYFMYFSWNDRHTRETIGELVSQ
jgi:hypothetical protein